MIFFASFIYQEKKFGLKFCVLLIKILSYLKNKIKKKANKKTPPPNHLYMKYITRYIFLNTNVLDIVNTLETD